jgi:hypothetical protein
MSDSTTTPRETGVPGRYLITQPSGPGLTILVDTVTGRSWFRITAGTDHYAWRPMQLELSVADLPPRSGSRDDEVRRALGTGMSAGPDAPPGRIGPTTTFDT